ncbi:GFA family protein [Rhodovastum atsumiense]|uniref:GFA family protein n=1 Tax=Rhodovastum atsumiense TaxID=504468 RepID=A0A5M6IXN0_9PROT|nr:GFA family protein [Rhodovastum atsumiense]KAA5613021.1 GFA family protein [Rhodovastum atsumiense]CAH2600128.1 GFA family protein [Rhodovastum atsumiense]
MGGPTSHHAHCLCGAVRFHALGPPNWVSTCHCDSCRRATGGTMVTFAGFPAEKVVFETEPPSAYESSPGVRRFFCARCGSSIAYQVEGRDELDLHVTIFDDPAAFVPLRHTHIGEVLPWVNLTDDLPRFPRGSGDSPPLDDGG